MNENTGERVKNKRLKPRARLRMIGMFKGIPLIENYVEAWVIQLPARRGWEFVYTSITVRLYLVHQVFLSCSLRSLLYVSISQ